jgi:hypothetical protein
VDLVNANVADDSAMAHLSAGVSRIGLGTKSIVCCLEISENCRTLENPYLTHFNSEKYK